MRSRKKGSAFHGLLLIDKPVGVTSHDVVSRVRRILGTRSVGHSGTLDPLASGLMVLLIGDATKLSRYILERDKHYELCFELGKVTDTLDITGEVLSESVVDISAKHLQTEIENLEGAFDWSVPRYSAVKVNGKKLYEYAREGIEVEVPSKEMRFWDIEIQKLDASTGRVSLTCSKGSYVRSWVDELGKNLGCGAVLTNLRRTGSDPYDLSGAVTLDFLSEQMEHKGAVEHLEAFIPMARTLPHWQACLVSGRNEQLLLHGQISADLKGRLGGFVSFEQELSGVKVLSAENQKLLALLPFVPGKGFQIGRVFN